MISLGRVVWALELTCNVLSAGSTPRKKVLIVAVALTFTTALLLASEVMVTLSTGGAVSRPTPAP